MVLPGSIASQAPKREDWIPRELKALRDEQAAALAAQASAFQSTIAELEQIVTEQAAIVAALAAPEAHTITATSWQATHGAAIATITIPWPEGKTQCDVFATMNGFYQADGAVPMSDRPSFHIEIEGVVSAPLPRIPDNMDTYHLTGSLARRTDWGLEFTIRVLTMTGATLSPAYPTNRVTLNALVVFS